MPQSDNEIIEKIRKGEKHYYARIIELYKDKAMTLAVRMLKNHEDAEEATQDAFIRAFRGLDKFQGSAKFGTWFYRIVYNVCLSKLGTRKEEFQKIEYNDEQEYDDVDFILRGNVKREVEMRDMVGLLKTAIKCLPEKYGSILSLFYFQELSHAEICEVTQLPLGTVKVRLHRARVLPQKKLSQELKPEKVGL